MADYQYLPDMNDPLAKLRLAMDNMDGNSLPSLPPFLLFLSNSVEVIDFFLSLSPILSFSFFSYTQVGRTEYSALR